MYIILYIIHKSNFLRIKISLYESIELKRFVFSWKARRVESFVMIPVRIYQNLEYIRDFISWRVRQGTLFLSENAREHSSRPWGYEGNRGVKSNGFNFCLDSPTSLLLYTQLAIYAVEPPRTFTATPLGFVIRGIVLFGASNESGDVGCWEPERLIRNGSLSSPLG